MKKMFWFTDRLNLDANKGTFYDLRPRQDDRRILKNPHKGWYWHFVEGGFSNQSYRQGYEKIHEDGSYEILDDVTDFPGLNHLYIRFNWGDIEQEKGVYDWTPIDRLMDAWGKKGFQFALRACSFMGNYFPATPQYVLDMGAKYKDFFIDNMWTKEPIYDDPIYLERLAAFMEEYGRKFNGDPRVEYIDMGTFGTWGEASASVMYPTEVIKKHMELHIKNFPDTYIMINDDFFAGRGGREMREGETQELLDYARENGMTLRDDSICYTAYVDMGNYHSLLVPTVYDALYPNGPIDTEFCHSYYYENEKCADGESAFQDGFRALAAVERGRVTFAGFHSHPRKFMEAHPGMAKYCANRLGYWYFLEGMQIPAWKAGQQAECTLYITNRGYAHANHKYDLKLRFTPLQGGDAIVIDCPETDNRKWEPCGVSSFDHATEEKLHISLDNVAAGEYKLQIGLFEKDRPVYFGVFEAEEDNGWAQVGQVTVE
ncbi:MAG: DUF4832 domain-containing protein [Clostridiales bacterium]|nr:DUF4832 domain-containing protein [Clostridiales bacterium]